MVGRAVRPQGEPGDDGQSRLGQCLREGFGVVAALRRWISAANHGEGGSAELVEPLYLRAPDAKQAVA